MSMTDRSAQRRPASIPLALALVLGSVCLPQAQAADAFLLLLALLIFRNVFTISFRQKHDGSKPCSKARHDQFAF